ncbi:Ula1 protein [Saccharomycopsis crataegensis]|uniref:NEDD8-activating enzyme E1 regulatory subunit n=1 Tax=Saccharomycopsis crataegensis TaxID=43959 RepID=A0AAV5QKE6_9ASCO|nr:Ula1 protein [Saccharomycopsis crataegensis]
MVVNEQKYDRQLRLWASDGQQDLEESHVCLINATSTGCEILKNLVLPNVGQFTIIDGESISERDLSSNFFLEEGDYGKLRAAVATESLKELNPSVHGQYLGTSIDDFLIEHCSVSSFWNKFSLIIFTSSFKYNVSFHKLVSLIYGKIPILEANSVGFYGSLKLIFNERTIIQTHLNEIPDLRIDLPWPELSDYLNGLNIEKLSIEELKNIPYSLLLMNFRRKYVDATGNEKPTRKDFKKFVETDELVKDIRYAALENIEELLKFSWRGTTRTTIPSTIQQILEDSNTLSSPLSSSPFWVLVKALKRFVNENGCLPLSGKIVDMASSTEKYIELQKLYREKAEKDKKLIEEYASDISAECIVSQALLDNFCKNSQYLVVQKGSKDFVNNKMVNAILTGDNSSRVSIQMAFLTLGVFCENHEHQYPKMEDLPELIDITETRFLNGNKVPLSSKGGDEDSKYIKTLKEFIRMEGCEMINTASFIGGLGGQEALKILTNQYVPLNNTLVYDGIESSIEKWKV